MEINYLKLYLSLSLVGLTVWAFDESLDSYRAQIIEEKSKAYSDKLALEAKSREIRAQTEALRLKNQRIQQANKQKAINSARKTNDEVCRFWSKEYIETKTDRNKTMRDNACERARKD